MTEEERIIEKLISLLKTDLTTIIEQKNEEHNDGILLEPLTEVYINYGNGKQPYATLQLKKAEYTEKDRIIQNTVYEIGIDVDLLHNGKEGWRYRARYKEALEELIKQNRQTDAWQWAKATYYSDCRFVVRVTV